MLNSVDRREDDMISVSSRAELGDAERILQARLIRTHQRAGVTFRDPAGTFLVHFNDLYSLNTVCIEKL